jgi:hypothetical protein
MSKEISRRQFLENVGFGAAAGTSLLLLKDIANAQPGTDPIPSRTLGRTGAKVSILAFGCGSRFLMYKDEESATAILNRAIDLGITYLDTAYAYGDGGSETRVGKVSLASQGGLAGNQDSRSYPRRISPPPRGKLETAPNRSCGPGPHP